jgi:hypothetical protein
MDHSLERDLLKSGLIEKKVQDDQYAKDLYAALCNNDFTKEDKVWSCSWRHAGGIVAQLRWKNESYIDFYCSGNEGNITEEIRKDLETLGWYSTEQEN